MNWRRGFFRLWLVTSVLWLTGTAILIYIEWPSPVPGTITRQASPDEIAACTAILPHHGNLTVDEILKDAQCSTHSENALVTDYSTVKVLGLLGIGVPVLLICSGAAAGWVLYGFKR